MKAYSKRGETEWKVNILPIALIVLMISMIVSVLIYNTNQVKLAKEECPKFNMTPVEGDYTCMNITDGVVTIYNLKKINGEWYLVK
jgi:hypothetical protein